MIADWTVDISPESPLIVLPWEQWTDLAWGEGTAWPAEAAAALPEVHLWPELLPLLRWANHDGVRTAKVDVFPVSRDEVDPEIAEAGLEETAYGLGSYLDVLPETLFSNFKTYEQVARRAVSAIGDASSPLLAMTEIVVRPAQLYDKQTFGWTLYATGFAGDAAQARTVWAEAARILVLALKQAIAGVETEPRLP